MLAFPFLIERTAVKCIQNLSEELVVPSCQAVRPVYHYLLKSSPGFAIRGKTKRELSVERPGSKMCLYLHNFSSREVLALFVHACC